MKKHLTALLAACALTACSEDSNDDSATETATTSADNPSSSNPLALLVPENLTLSVFPSSSTALLEDKKAESGEEKIGEHHDRLTGEASECFDPAILQGNNGTQETCYEFDNDFNPYTYDNGSGGTENGLNADGEACIVAFARGEIADMQGRYDFINALTGSGLCEAAKADDTTLPAVGDTKDLSAYYTTALSAAGFTVEKAIGKRLGENDFLLSVKFYDHNNNLHRVSSVKSVDEDGYEFGVVNSAKVLKAGEPALNDPNNSENKFELFSVRYAQTSDDNVRYRMLTANKEKTYEQFDETGEVYFADLEDNASNSDVHAISLVAFDGNASTTEGRLSYWKNPGGSLNESARGFNFDSAVNADGLLAGCGITGSTNNISIRAHISDAEANILSPTKYWHPRGDQNTHSNKDSRYVYSGQNTEGNKISEQCFLATAAGPYEITTDDARGYEVIETSATSVEPPRFDESKKPDHVFAEEDAE